MEVIRRREGYLFHPTDGHRHFYNMPPYRVAGVLTGMGISIRKYIRNPSTVRRCKLCGYHENEIRKIKRDRPTLPVPVPSTIPIANALSEAYKAAQEIADTNPGGLNNFTLICDKGDETLHIVKKRQGYCYSGLGGQARGKPTLYFIDKAGYGCGWTINDEYVRWLYEDSPFNMALVNDVAHYKRTRCTISSTELPAQYVVQGTMAFRYQCEYKQFIALWAWFSEMGMDPAIAFLLCQFGTKYNDMYRFNGAVEHGHTIFDKGFMRNGLDNYLNKRIQKVGYNGTNRPVTLVPAKGNMNYHGLMGAWQGKCRTKDSPIQLPGSEKRTEKDSLGRETTGEGMPCKAREDVLAIQSLFITANEVSYEPKESVYCQRRPSVCTDVPVSRVESVEA